GGDITEGLGLVPGRVMALDTGNLPSPHMGWNRLTDLIDDPLTQSLAEGDHAYFVHSYAAPVAAATIATAIHGSPFSAIIRHGNVRGCQFHPERSSATGASILKAFAAL
ncbi:MAG: imidazole glycerol phosphate synthase subunit HisH, partial [Pseudomonadota bacterium]